MPEHLINTWAAVPDTWIKRNDDGHDDPYLVIGWAVFGSGVKPIVWTEEGPRPLNMLGRWTLCAGLTGKIRQDAVRHGVVGPWAF